MKELLTVSGIASSATMLPAQTTWKLVPVNSKLAFIATHLGIAGLFKTFNVTIIHDMEGFMRYRTANREIMTEYSAQFLVMHGQTIIVKSSAFMPIQT